MPRFIPGAGSAVQQETPSLRPGARLLAAGRRVIGQLDCRVFLLSQPILVRRRKDALAGDDDLDLGREAPIDRFYPSTQGMSKLELDVLRVLIAGSIPFGNFSTGFRLLEWNLKWGPRASDTVWIMRAPAPCSKQAIARMVRSLLCLTGGGDDFAAGPPP